MRAQGLTVGVDVGGTLVKLGILKGRRILAERKLPTRPISKSPRHLEEGVVQAVKDLLRQSGQGVSAVGVGIPGLVQYPSGVVDSCANLPGWKKIPLRAHLARRLQLPVQVDNDANLMCLAEWVYGAGRGVKNLICLTLGTGVGGGLILDGKLYRGFRGAAGEIGHLPLAMTGPACSCGGKACLERFVGNRDILRWVRNQSRKGARSRILKWVDGDLSRLTPPLIDQACRMGDPLAREAWARVGTHVGLALAGVVNLLNPERIVVGGGVAQAGDWIFKSMRQTLEERAMRGLGKIPIVPATLGPSAGLIGAGLSAQGVGDGKEERGKRGERG